MPEPYAFIDEEFKKASEAKISVLEPTVTKSDAVYDTISVLNRKIFRFDDQKNVDSKFRKVQRDEAKQRGVAPQHEPR